jgi:hypothetical protein
MSTADAVAANDVATGPARDPHAQFLEALPLMIENLALSRNLRTGAALMSALIGLIWFDWKLVAGYIVLVFFYEGMTFPYLLKRFVMPMSTRNPRQAHIAFAASNLSGALLYTFAWAPVLATSTVLGALVGAGWFWGTLIHNMTYNSRDRLVFATTMVPPVVAAAIVPFFMNLTWWAPWLALYLTAQGVVAMLLSTKDRNRLAMTAERHEKARHVAEDANVAKVGLNWHF